MTNSKRIVAALGLSVMVLSLVACDSDEDGVHDTYNDAYICVTNQSTSPDCVPSGGTCNPSTSCVEHDQ